jgi:outer membrane murein-binding lipoprotein Lpp
MSTSTSPSGGEVAELNAKISGLEAELTGLQGVVRALQEQSKKSMQPVAPTAPSGGEVAELNAKIRGLEQKNIKRYKEIQDLLRANDRLWVVLSRDYLRIRDSHSH